MKAIVFVHRWLWLVLAGYCLVGILYPAVGLVALACMLAPVVTAYFTGRTWCGYFCPRGSLLDRIPIASKRRRRVPYLFKQAWFRLGFSLFVMAAFAVQLVLAAKTDGSMGPVFVRMVLLTSVLAVLLGEVFHRRAWCLICPMGTMAMLLARIVPAKSGRKRVAFTGNLCTGCQVCTRNCPMLIKVHRYKETGVVYDTDCYNCRTCIKLCPQKALSVTKVIKTTGVSLTS